MEKANVFYFCEHELIDILIPIIAFNFHFTNSFF